MSVVSLVPPPVRPAGTRQRASRLGYWIGGALVAAAFIGAAAWVVLAFVNQVNGFQRMTVPGTATVQVAQPGTRVVYHESTRAASPPGQLVIRVTGPAGEPVTVSAYHGDMRYDVPGVAGRAGRAIASFQAVAAGNYRISADPGARGGGTLAIGGDVLWDVVLHFAGASAIFVLAGGAGLTLIITTAVRRSARTASQRGPAR